jgi:hypothetical protein
MQSCVKVMHLSGALWHLLYTATLRCVVRTFITRCAHAPILIIGEICKVHYIVLPMMKKLFRPHIVWVQLTVGTGVRRNHMVNYPCSGCTSACGILIATSGTVSDGPSDYSNSANCKWLIASTSATRITITFFEFSTEFRYDFVTLSSCTDVSCASKQQLLQHSGALPSPQSFTSDTGFLMVEFTSDGSGVLPGFSAMWTSEIPVSLPISTN